MKEYPLNASVSHRRKQLPHEPQGLTSLLREKQGVKVGGVVYVNCAGLCGVQCGIYGIQYEVFYAVISRN